MSEKSIFWLGSSREDLRAFPEESRRIAGHCLHLVQQGIEPPDWKPMKSVGLGVYELRIHTRAEYRIFYVAKFTEGIYILHAFEKRTKQTAKADIELARNRLGQLLIERQKQKYPSKR